MERTPFSGTELIKNRNTDEAQISYEEFVSEKLVTLEMNQHVTMVVKGENSGCKVYDHEGEFVAHFRIINVFRDQSTELTIFYFKGRDFAMDLHNGILLMEMPHIIVKTSVISFVQTYEKPHEFFKTIDLTSDVVICNNRYELVGGLIVNCQGRTVVLKSPPLMNLSKRFKNFTKSTTISLLIRDLIEIEGESKELGPYDEYYPCKIDWARPLREFKEQMVENLKRPSLGFKRYERMPKCWRCESPVSDAQNGLYKCLGRFPSGCSDDPVCISQWWADLPDDAFRRMNPEEIRDALLEQYQFFKEHRKVMLPNTILARNN